MSLPQKTAIVPLLVACAIFMEIMDVNVVATALPAMAHDFGRDPITLKIAVTSYVLGLGIFIPICGWMADRFGARTIFRLAICIFMGGSLLCGASNSLVAFTLARFVQGIGGAMMVPVGRIIIFRAVPRAEFILAMNYLSIPALLGPAAGPLLGGFVTTYLHWRLIFLINIPIGIFGVYLATRYIANSHERHPGRLDRLGFFLSASGGSSFLLGLSLIDGQLVSGQTAFGMCAIGVSLLLSYWRHAQQIKRPILDFRFLRVPTFQASVVGGSLFRIGLGGVPFLLPLALQEALGTTAFQCGLITCASAFGGMFMRTITPRVLRHFGFRTVLIYNAAFAGIAIAVCGLFFPSTPIWLIWVVVLLGGFFPALQFTSLNALAYADIADRDVSPATSLAIVVQQLSLGLGVTVAGIALQISRGLQGHTSVSWSDFWPAFLVGGLFSVASIAVTQRLPCDAGAEMSRGHRA